MPSIPPPSSGLRTPPIRTPGAPDNIERMPIIFDPSGPLMPLDTSGTPRARGAADFYAARGAKRPVASYTAPDLWRKKGRGR